MLKTVQKTINVRRVRVIGIDDTCTPQEKNIDLPYTPRKPETQEKIVETLCAGTDFHPAKIVSYEDIKMTYEMPLETFIKNSTIKN